MVGASLFVFPESLLGEDDDRHLVLEIAEGGIGGDQEACRPEPGVEVPINVVAGGVIGDHSGRSTHDPDIGILGRILRRCAGGKSCKSKRCCHDNFVDEHDVLLPFY